MALKTSSIGRALIKEFEGCRLTAYKCPAGVWTIGWGTTKINGKAVSSGMTITSAQAEEYLKADLVKYENNVNKFDSKYKWNQNEFDALVSFAYNIGSIDQLTANGTRSRTVIADSIPLYCKANGVSLAGLVRRRDAERTLFMKPIKSDQTQGDKVTSSNGVDPTDYSNWFNGATTIASVQLYVNTKYGLKIAQDGKYGSETKKALVKVYQTEMNLQYGAGLTVDGIYGTKSKAAAKTIKKDARGNITALIQCIAICNGVSVGNAGVDGIYGSSTVSAVKSLQSKKKLSADGIVGVNTWSAYLA